MVLLLLFVHFCLPPFNECWFGVSSSFCDNLFVFFLFSITLLYRRGLDVFLSCIIAYMFVPLFVSNLVSLLPWVGMSFVIVTFHCLIRTYFGTLKMLYKVRNKKDELIKQNYHFLENDKSTLNPTHRYIIYAMAPTNCKPNHTARNFIQKSSINSDK